MKMLASEFLDLDHVHTEITGTTRWAIQKASVAEINGRFYRGKYRVPATECQSEEYDYEMELTEVHKVEQIVKVWEPVQ